MGEIIIFLAVSTKGDQFGGLVVDGCNRRHRMFIDYDFSTLP
jgi:hypothetical protein